MSGDERRQVDRGAGAFAAGTLVSRITGFVRDAAIVAVFGAAVNDIWVLAWTLPNSLRRVVGAGTVTISFVPIFADTLENEGPEAARRFLSRVLTAAMLALLLVVTAGVVATPWILRLLAPDWAEVPEKFALAVEVGRWTFPYLWIIGTVSLIAAALQGVRRFFITTVSQALLNLALISGALVFRHYVDPPLLALAWCALIGGGLQLASNVYVLIRNGYTPGLDFAIRDPAVRRFFFLMVPAAFGASVNQVNLLISRGMATSVGPGAVTWLYNATLVAGLPLGLFGVSIAMASLPSLSRQAARGDMEGYRETLAGSLRRLLYIMLPATVGMAVLATPIMVVIFQRGAYTHHDATQAGLALMIIATGVPAIAAARLVVQGFYALADTRTPMVVGVVAVGGFVVTALSLLDAFGHLGIAAATSVAAWIDLIANLVLLRRKTSRLGLGRVAGSVSRSAIGCAVMGPLVFFVASLGTWERGISSLRVEALGNLGIFLGAVAIGAAAYAAVTLALGSTEARGLLQVLRRRLGRAAG